MLPSQIENTGLQSLSKMSSCMFFFFPADQIKSYLNHCQPHVRLSQKGYIQEKKKSKKKDKNSQNPGLAKSIL